MTQAPPYTDDAFMFRFARHAPLDTTTFVAPTEDDRSGPPLTQGFLFTMVSTVAADHCSKEVLDLLAKIEPNSWYHGQLFETLLSQFEDRDPELPGQLGRHIHFMMRSLVEQMGVSTPRGVIEAIPAIWKGATHGDCGEWRVAVGPRRAHIEAEQPYNCLFEAGAVRGLLEAQDARNVRIVHAPCMRAGAPFCVFEVRWDEDGASR